MQKLFKSGISMVLAIIMLISVFESPLAVIAHAAGDVTDVSTEISFGELTSTKEQAFADATAFKSSKTNNLNGGIVWANPEYLFKRRDKNASTNTGKPSNADSNLRDMLESTESQYKYIALTCDLDERSDASAYDTIEVTSDHVLDLNGYSVTYRADHNAHDDNSGALSSRRQRRETPGAMSAVFINISNGATLTIIDSSQNRGSRKKEGDGKMAITGQIISPFSHIIKYYTNRDLFHVDDGNLVIYGGNFQAGRMKSQVKSNFDLDKLKTTIGTAVELGVNVASYATGVDAAVAAKNDLNDSIKKAKESIGDDAENSSGVPSTNKNKPIPQDEENKKASSPSGESADRNKTVDEKQRNIDNNEKGKKTGSENSAGGKNTSDEKNDAAKSDKDLLSNKNSKISEANKKITDAALDQKSISGIIDGVFELGKSIASMFGNDESTRITQTIMGTVVRVGNNGTFVSYGGNFDGYGQTPNVRDAVVEVVRNEEYNNTMKRYPGGKAYIFGGNFNAYAGANVFNFVNTNGKTKAQTVTKNEKTGEVTYGSVTTLHSSETGGGEQGQQILTYETGTRNKGELIDTSNVQVRGGKFENYYELFNVGTQDGDDDFTKFPGTAGAVGLGIGSFNTGFIKDGRIQIDDLHGDGALVLMDDNTGGDGKLYHYRLFCSDTELRNKQGLKVYPNNSLSNSTNTLAIRSSYDNDDTETKVKVFKNDEDNIRAALSSQERVLLYPYNGSSKSTYTLSPSIDNVTAKSDEEEINASPSWYYCTPKDTNDKPIQSFVLHDAYLRGTMQTKSSQYTNTTDPNSNKAKWGAVSGTNNKLKGTLFGKDNDTVYVDRRTTDSSDWQNAEKVYSKNTIEYYTFSENYQSNVKWFTYNIYKVDPLTRDNIDAETGLANRNAKPLARGVYGTKSGEMAKVVITLSDLEEIASRSNISWEGFKDGEMYRVELEVEESLDYNYQGYDVESNYVRTAKGSSVKPTYAQSLGTAKAKSSMLVLCYDENEIKTNPDNPTGDKIPDYTPLQWAKTPQAGEKAQIELVNGLTGNIDWRLRQMFDIYYQWWRVDEDGNKLELIAGTTDVWDVKSKYTAGKTALANSSEELVVTEDMQEKDPSTYKVEDIGTTTLNFKLRNGKTNHTITSMNRAGGKLYKNPIAPNDECLNWVDKNGKKLEYDENGLPVVRYENNGAPVAGTNRWPAKNSQSAQLLHAYAYEWKDDDALRKNTSKKISMNNNNAAYGNMDSCYISEDLAGERIMVEAVVINTFWPDYYDVLQTFRSHIFTVEGDTSVRELDPLGGDVKLSYSGSYITDDKPVTVSLDNVTGLDQERGEYVKYIYYYFTSPSGKTSMLNTEKIEARTKEEIASHSVQFPGRLKGMLKESGEYKIYATYSTNLYGTVLKKGRPYEKRIYDTVSKTVNYEVEAKKLTVASDTYTYDYDDIAVGKVENGTIKVVQVYPANASVAFDFSSDVTSSNKNVASVDENGCLAFGGSVGSTTITVNSPDGKKHTTKVTVNKYLEDIKVTNVQPPELGKTFKTNVSIPSGANYSVVDTYWTDSSGKRLSASDTAKNYKAYTINVVVRKNSGFTFRGDSHPHILEAGQPDGTVDSVSGTVGCHYLYNLNSNTGQYEIGDDFVMTYTYYNVVGGVATNSIDKIYINLPEEVEEGTHISDFADKVHVSTNGEDDSLDMSVRILGNKETTKQNAVLRAYGYKKNHYTYNKNFNVFVKDAVQGVEVDLKLPEDSAAFFSSGVMVSVNGEDLGWCSDYEMESGNSLRLTIKDRIAVLPGKPIEDMPWYVTKPLSFVLNKPVCLDDYLITDDTRLSLKPDPEEMASDDSYYKKGYFAYDEDTNTITPLKTANSLYQPFYVYFDCDGDGYAEMAETPDLLSSRVYNTEADAPADNSGDITVTVKALKPDGSTAYTKSVVAYCYDKTKAYGNGETYMGYLCIPRVDGAVISKVETNNPSTKKFWYDVSGGFERLRAAVEQGDTLTVYTVDANEGLTVNPSSTGVFPSIKGVSDEVISYSLDNIHWNTEVKYFNNLEPDTDYIIFYRQGVNGELFSKPFKTESKDETLGVYVGKTPLTKSNPGVLERDGYHYDASTKTLTIKDLTLTDHGTLDVEHNHTGTIRSEDNITVEVLGKNYIKYGIGIYSAGSLTLTGAGDLSLGEQNADNIASTMGLHALYAENDINLKGTGTYLARCDDYMYESTNGTVYYYNGTYKIVSYDEINQFGNKYFYVEGKLNVVNTDHAVHQPKYYAYKGNVEVSDPRRAWQNSADKTNLKNYHDSNGYSSAYQVDADTLCGTHTYNKQVVNSAYYVNGNCTSGATYYKSCSCGAHSDTLTFKAAATSHKLIHHEGKAATCLEDGYKAYDTCENCNYSTFEVIPATGHTFVHHDEVKPDCDHDGCPAYDECTVCGLSSLPVKIQAANGGVAPTGSGKVDLAATGADSGEAVRDDIWTKLGHPLIYVPVKAATCTQAGMRAHYKCTECGDLYEDENGTIPVTEQDLVIPASGHMWGPWRVVKAATETQTGTERRICLRDPKHIETRDIPVQVIPTEPVDPTEPKPTTPPTPTEPVNPTEPQPGGTSGTIGSCKWSFNVTTGTLTISGSGAMPDYDDYNYRPWQDYSNDVKIVIVEKGVTAVGVNCFGFMPLLTSVTLPATVESIGNSAFSACDNLKTITLPTGLEIIGNAAFASTGLTSITIPDSVKEIGMGAFTDCQSLSSVTIGSGVTTIGSYAFFWCSSLKSITIPKNVTTIEEFAVGYDVDLEQGIEVPVSGFTICGEKGSAAETYANKNGFTFTVANAKKSIADCTVSGIAAKTYTGKTLTQSITVKYGTAVLKLGTDYTVAYKNNVNVGTATVTITGKGNYTGSVSKTFKINAVKMSACTISGIKAKTYTGKAQTQSVAVKYGSITLKSGTDYTVVYKNNTKVGTATVTITGKGNYTGSVNKTFAINKIKMSACTISGVKAKTYTGKAQTQSIVVKNGTATLKLGTHYTVAYKNNVKVGTATMTITGKGNFTGSLSKTFKINKAANPVTVKSAAKTVAYKTVVKKAVTGAPLTVTKAQGAVSYKLATKTSALTVNAKNGKVTVKKGTKKGTYTVKVQITAKGNANYKSATKTATVKITVK